MEKIWLALGLGFFAVIVGGLLSGRHNRKQREAVSRRQLPVLPMTLSGRFDVQMNDGRCFENVAVLGQIEGGENPLFDWREALVLELADGRRVYVRVGTVRCLVERPATGGEAEAELPERPV
ncbi:MAG: hypothetical protein Q4A62_08505 [Eikenella sp.]|nr:hypothetical protein [Eikenella sp.]